MGVSGGRDIFYIETESRGVGGVRDAKTFVRY